MPSEKEIEAAARAICKADMVLPDELSMGSGKPRWTQYMRQAKAALQAAEAVRVESISINEIEEFMRAEIDKGTNVPKLANAVYGLICQSPTQTGN